jgi:hypothetical protein
MTTKRRIPKIGEKLSDTEQDLLSRMEQGYQLETDSRGGNPVLRRLKDDDVLRPMSANSSTVKALEERGLIRQAKSKHPLTMVWVLTQKSKK